MLRIMRGLEFAATAIVTGATLPFVAAWDAKGRGSDKYREIVKNFVGIAISLLAIVAGTLCAILARLASLVDPLPGNKPGSHPRAYLYRRSYRGQHRTGTPLFQLLTTKELLDIAVAS